MGKLEKKNLDWEHGVFENKYSKIEDIMNFLFALCEQRLNSTKKPTDLFLTQMEALRDLVYKFYKGLDGYVKKLAVKGSGKMKIKTQADVDHREKELHGQAFKIFDKVLKYDTTKLIVSDFCGDCANVLNNIANKVKSTVCLWYNTYPGQSEENQKKFQEVFGVKNKDGKLVNKVGVFLPHIAEYIVSIIGAIGNGYANGDSEDVFAVISSWCNKKLAFYDMDTDLLDDSLKDLIKYPYPKIVCLFHKGKVDVSLEALVLYDILYDCFLCKMSDDEIDRRHTGFRPDMMIEWARKVNKKLPDHYLHYRKDFYNDDVGRINFLSSLKFFTVEEDN